MEVDSSGDEEPTSRFCCKYKKENKRVRHDDNCDKTTGKIPHEKTAVVEKVNLTLIDSPVKRVCVDIETSDSDECLFKPVFASEKNVAEKVNKKVLTHQLNDSSDSSEDEQGTDYLNDDPMFPIYRQGLLTGLASRKVVDILFHPPRELIARAVPSAVSENSVFVVEISAPHIKHFKNVLATTLVHGIQLERNSNVL